MDGSYRSVNGPRGLQQPKEEEGPWSKWFSRLCGVAASLIIISLTAWALVSIWGEVFK